MATEHENWMEQQGEIYALGALDGEELRLFEAHLASGCAACEARIREARETLTALPASLEPLTPPLEIKNALLDRLAPPVPPATVRPLRARRGLWLAGAGALAAAAAIFALALNLASSRRDLARLNDRLAVLESESAKKDEMIEFFTAPDVRAVELTGLAAAPQAKAKLFWKPAERRGLLLVSGLPQPDAGKAYELWGIAGSEPVPAGVFSVNEQGRGELRLPELPGEREYEKFAVTLEPAGGVPKPSGPMLLLGTL
jgi:anti-sigma-K factor RskA